MTARPAAPAGRYPAAPPGGQQLVALALGAAFGAGVLVWVTGFVAGWVWTGRGPALGVAATARVLMGLPGAPGDPRRAWPPPWSHRLPSAPWVYGVMLSLATLAASAAVALLVLWHRLRAARTRSARPPAPASRVAAMRQAGTGWHRPQGRGARWATGRDLGALRVSRGGGGRLVLGRLGRRLVATEARHSVLVLGPTQSGKTTGLAIPALLEWEGPVVATSVKGDLVDTTRAWRRTLGRTWVFDPTASSGCDDVSGWSPLDECASWTGAQRMAAWFVESTPSRGGLTDAAFWFAASAKLLGPLLLAAARSGRTMADVVRWVDLQEVDEVEAALIAAGEVDANVALAAGIARDERIRSSVYTTLETVLAPYEDPVVAASASRGDIDPRGLLDGANTLYLCGPAHEQARVQGVFSALVATVVDVAVARAQGGGHPLPLLMVLDEAANIAPVRDLDALASTAAGLGIQLVTVCQDLAQLSSRYGAERARTIANNHRAKVVLSGIADVGTLDTMSGLAGEQVVREETVTADRERGRRSTSSSIAYRRLAPADELRRIRPGEGVLVYGHHPPARIRLRPWYSEAALRRRVAPR